ncbi:globin domain-containing protein [Shewanella gaetbuli]|uniref:Globin domain-containing protein n=1 Tax=Shewanella gaetbuli TaxID=220752 RepID=A0A9X2CJN7_9GAMM|nr:globin domain-containing protein [Shewanella gaetbuli]MCL1144317.1 globin domain-containing protein [Shewanella gaetbuli]
MELTPQEIQLIQSSFAIIKAENINLSRTFYDHLFQMAPLVIPLFKTERAIQEKHFNEIFTTAVNKINQFESLRPLLFDLGVRHKNYNVKQAQFQVVKSALILSIQYELKDQSNTTIESAWANYYDNIAEVVIEGLNS